MITFKKAPYFGTELENLTIHAEGEKKYVQVCGGVCAGFPSPAEDFLSDRISLDERYLSKVESTFVNRVKGLSMYPEYLENDIIIIRSDYYPTDGDDIVVSINSSEYTLKRYDKANNRLVALNSDYAKSVTIDESDEVVILGVVDAVIRDKRKRK
ncbi:S24 family peptidase [Myroides ceti]|uniref:DNA repair protein n=2 Tax=Paenimyroides TaxID=3085669 RepID=A0A3P3W3N8_9FLAO|nr:MULTISPECIES: S24 family peptidase [Paenimyroides]MDN3709919.1 S24 family peptidase [Paenimyroides ceti]MDN3709982.1 S24 family peptidase [Paenimyroides ceti]MDN3710017.1 S24 family peptidase [Paenimyroides ceti]MDN3710554.1 S24 family peptidase [Paenimyroides ceti]RRJ89685.1 DNA repair protein [Paenimyroides tangerinum]